MPGEAVEIKISDVFGSGVGAGRVYYLDIFWLGKTRFFAIDLVLVTPSKNFGSPKRERIRIKTSYPRAIETIE